MQQKLLSIASPICLATDVDQQYHPAPHILLWDEALTDAIYNRGPKFIICEGPPRHGKSVYWSKWVPTWHAGMFPEQPIILTSYGASLASSHGRKVRDLLEEIGEDYFGVGVSESVSARADWETTEGGGMVTAGVSGPITGRGAKLFIVDDYIKNSKDAMSEVVRNDQWDWWISTASTRFEPGSIVVIMATRWHDDDLIGRILKQHAEEGIEHRHIRLEALCTNKAKDPMQRMRGQSLWKARWPRKLLLEKKRRMVKHWWSAMYQQKPTVHGDAEWPEDYFPESIWVPPRDFPSSFEIHAVATDPAQGKDKKKGDYVAALRGGIAGDKLYISGLVDRIPWEELVDSWIEWDHTYPDIESFGVEENSWQDLLKPLADYRCRELRRRPLSVHLINNRVNKQIRIRRVGPYLREGQLRFEDTPHMRRLVDQLMTFPLGDHDDGPDALEMLIRLILLLRDGEAEPQHEDAQSELEEVTLL